MTILLDYDVAPTDMVGLICPNTNCGKHMTRREWGTKRDLAAFGDRITCQHCENDKDNTFREFTPDDCKVDVESRSADLVNAAPARAATWYHATTRENWDKNILVRKPQEGDLFVHLGTKSAAVERIHDSLDHKGGTFYLHEVKLVEDANLASHILSDGNCWPTHTNSDERYADSWEPVDWKNEIQAYDAVRYLNRWETPGSVSMLARATKIQVVKSSLTFI
jgi:hypothetical protein